MRLQLKRAAIDLYKAYHHSRKSSAVCALCEDAKLSIVVLIRPSVYIRKSALSAGYAFDNR
jgi:hypothetical protein